MARITEISIEHQDVWDSTVRSFSDYDVFYLSGYSKAFMREDPKNGTPILLLYEEENDRAINVVLKRDIALDEKLAGKIVKGQYFDLITPLHLDISRKLPLELSGPYSMFHNYYL